MTNREAAVKFLTDPVFCVVSCFNNNRNKRQQWSCRSAEDRDICVKEYTERGHTDIQITYP